MVREQLAQNAPGIEGASLKAHFSFTISELNSSGQVRGRRSFPARMSLTCPSVVWLVHSYDSTGCAAPKSVGFAGAG